MAKQTQQLKIKLIRSPIRQKPNHRKTVLGLGLKKMHQEVVREDNACIRGMINKVSYLLSVEEVTC